VALPRATVTDVTAPGDRAPSEFSVLPKFAMPAALRTGIVTTEAGALAPRASLERLHHGPFRVARTTNFFLTDGSPSRRGIDVVRCASA
jgi:hypothetical protein